MPAFDSELDLEGPYVGSYNHDDDLSDDKADRAVTTGLSCTGEPGGDKCPTTAGEPRHLVAEKAAIAKAEPYRAKLEAFLRDDMGKLLVRLIQVSPNHLIHRIKVIREITGLDLHSAKIVADLFSKRDIAGTRDLFSELKLYDPERAAVEDQLLEAKDNLADVQAELHAAKAEIEVLQDELKTVKSLASKSINARRIWKKMVQAGLEEVELPSPIRNLWTASRSMNYDDTEELIVDRLGLYRWIHTGFASLRDDYLHPVWLYRETPC